MTIVSTGISVSSELAVTGLSIGWELISTGVSTGRASRFTVTLAGKSADLAIGLVVGLIAALPECGRRVSWYNFSSRNFEFVLSCNVQFATKLLVKSLLSNREVWSGVKLGFIFASFNESSGKNGTPTGCIGELDANHSGSTRCSSLTKTFHTCDVTVT